MAQILPTTMTAIIEKTKWNGDEANTGEERNNNNNSNSNHILLNCAFDLRLTRLAENQFCIYFFSIQVHLHLWTNAGKRKKKQIQERRWHRRNEKKNSIFTINRTWFIQNHLFGQVLNISIAIHLKTRYENKKYLWCGYNTAFALENSSFCTWSIWRY